MTIEVKSRSKTLKSLSTDDISLGDKISVLTQLIGSVNKTATNRIRLTQLVGEKQVPLDAEKTLLEQGLTEDAQLFVKDLGPQLSWRLVYIVEYFGPLFIHPLFHFIATTYGVGFGPFKSTQTQEFALALAFLHFLKRELETIFLHVFSNSTMPAKNIVRNSTHYWIFGGLLISAFSYATPAVSADSNILVKFLFRTNDFSPVVNWSLTYLWAIFEYLNFQSHSTLAWLRTKDSKNYAIPYGFEFNKLSCPNYTFEIAGWITYSILIGNWSAWVFTIFGAYTMTVWAAQRHKKYLKTFGDDYKKLRRNVIIPYVY